MVLIRWKLFRRIWIILIQTAIFVDADSENYFCEHEELVGRKFVLKKTSNQSIKCVSSQQINWTFNETIVTKNNETRLPFFIESQWKSCHPEYSWNASVYYFVSTLTVTSTAQMLEEGSDWSRTVSCGPFGGQRSLGAPSIQLRRINNSAPVFVESGYVAPLHITMEPQDWSGSINPSDLVLINVDRSEDTCVCQIRAQLVQPHFINCDNLVHCEFLARQFNVKAHPGMVNLFCQTQTMGFLPQKSLNVSSPGILLCAGDNGPKSNLMTADFAPYAPFVPLTFVDPFWRLDDNSSDVSPPNQKIIVLKNEVSSFADFLSLKNESWVFFSAGGLESSVHYVHCSGPKFLFLSEFRLRPRMDQKNSSIMSNDQLTDLFITNQTTVETDDRITSTWTLRQWRAGLTRDLDLTVVCEAAVRNGNEIVSIFTSLTIPGPRPIVDPIPPGKPPSEFESNCTSQLYPAGDSYEFFCHHQNESFYCKGSMGRGFDHDWILTCACCPGIEILCLVPLQDDLKLYSLELVLCLPDFSECDENATTTTSTSSSTSVRTTKDTTLFPDPPPTTSEPTTEEAIDGKTSSVAAAENKGTVNLGLAILIAAAIMAAILGLVGLAYLQRRRIRRKFRKILKKHDALPEHVVKEFLEGKNSIDPNDLHGLIHSQPFNPNFEIRRRDLALDPKNLLGAGQYGNVMKGFLRRDTSNLTNGPVLMLTVAVKTIKPNADLVHFKALLAEIKILTHLGRHQNIIRFIGASTENIKIREIFVVVEFCVKGDLQKLLRRCRPSFQNLLTSTLDDEEYYVHFGPSAGPSTVSTLSTTTEEKANDDVISTLNLLSWAVGISNGMTYLGFKKVIHGDLACRNVLISEDNVAKVSDFSLSHQLVQNYDSYTTTQKMPMPWKYMSLEALQDLNFSTQSDVWSFGVTLWEIFSLGSSPYAGSQWNKDFMDRIRGGYRLDRPPFADDDVYDLMVKCWTMDPEMRPKFPEIYNRLQKIFSNFESSCNGDYYMLDRSTVQPDLDI